MSWKKVPCASRGPPPSYAMTRVCATNCWRCEWVKGGSHAIREHPHTRGSSAGAQGRDCRRVTETISEVAQLPKEAVWVVFEDVAADDWYVGPSRVSELKRKAAQS